MLDSNSLLLPLGATFITACTLISDFDVHACRDDAECAFPERGVARCEQQRCVPGCRDNHNCAVWDPRTPICPSVDSGCVSLASTDDKCPVSTGYVDETMGALVARDMLIVGALVPAPESSAWLTIELAASEIATAGGLLDPRGKRRPVVAVACDAAGDDLEPPASHLVESLGISGIISTLDAASLSSVLTLPATRDSTLMMSVRGAAAEPPPDPPEMVWQLGAPATSAAGLYPPLVDRIDRGLVARRGAEALPRVVSLVSRAAEDIALADAVLPMLTLRGAGASELLRQDRHRRLTLNDVAPDRRASLLADVITYAPDIVLVFAGGYFDVPSTEERSGVVRALENAAAEGGWSPVYVFGPANVADSALRAHARGSASFRARAFGVASAAAFDRELARGLDERYLAAFPLAENDASPFVYDAFYQLAYAMAPAGSDLQQADVRGLIEGLARVAEPSAPAISVGPSGLHSSTGFLTTGAPFKLAGVTGAALGSQRVREAAPVAYCFDVPEASEMPAERAPVVLVFDVPSTPSPRVGRACAQEALP